MIDQITRENLDEVLSGHVGAGDLLIDLAWNIDCTHILEWCRDHGVRYVNTSVELWDPVRGRRRAPPARPHALRAPHGAAPR